MSTAPDVTPPVLLANVIARLRAAADGLTHVAEKASKSIAEKAIAQVVGINEAIRLLQDQSTALAEARQEIERLNAELQTRPNWKDVRR